jgi:cytochrome c peroxidase
MIKRPTLHRPPKFIITIFLASLLVFLAASNVVDKRNARIEAYYLDNLNNLKNELITFKSLCSAKTSVVQLKEEFRRSRSLFKRLSVLTDYFNPYETQFLNGAARKRVEEDNPNVIIDPHGFQYLEEIIFGKWSAGSYALLSNELAFDLGLMDRMVKSPDVENMFSDETVFEAMRLSVIRIMTLGITGSDSPVALNSISETASVVSGIRDIIDFYKDDIIKKNEQAYTTLQMQLEKITVKLNQDSDFNSFDRLQFITEYANPLFQLITQTRDLVGIRKMEGKIPLRPEAVSIYQDAAFNISFFSPDKKYEVTTERVKLGKLLFSDPILSVSNKRSCASCHKPELAFTDGQKVPLAIDNKTLLKRNTPTLWNSVFQTRQFYDSRTDFLEMQLGEVVHNAEEMKGSLTQAAIQMKSHSVYGPLFSKAYANQKNPFTAYNIANAISSYVRTLVAMQSRFDRFIQGDPSLLNQNEKHGFNLFMGKARCGTCHFFPLFNGLLPPDFEETESEVLGIPAADHKKTPDTDPGKYLSTKSEIDRFSFKTPTLRNIQLTAPYMHNGVFKNLDEVIDFYNKGGGRGLKIKLPNQTLPFDKLNLSSRERNDIISFLKTLTDTTYRFQQSPK